MSILAHERISERVTCAGFKRFKSELFRFGDEVDASMMGVRRGGVFASGEDVAG